MRDSDTVAVLERLQQQGALSASQMTTLAEESRTSGVPLLVLINQKRVVDEETMAKVHAEVVGLPYVQLVDQEIPGSVLDIINRDIANSYSVVPWAREGNTVSIGMVDPHDYKAIEALDFIARNAKVVMKYYVISTASFRWVIRQYDNLREEVAEALETPIEGDAIEEQLALERDESVQSAPVSKMVSVILRYAVEGKASDVHIEPMDDGTRVRYRVDGVLHTSLQVPKNIHSALVARIKVLANLKLDETRLPQDGRFRMKLDGHEVDFRVSTMPLVGQEKVVLRILDQASGLLSLEDLGFTDRNLGTAERHLKSPHGMVLLTGPTGSGKSTSLYSMLQILNQEQRNIITLEDPVEYNLSGIAQSQVHPDIGLTFARGLRSVLRQDPDVIMVGEIRDNETAELAIHAALTGHMLLSTLHTNDALGAIPRLIDMDIEPFLISSALNLIVAQRLVRKICEHCREQVVLPVSMESDVMLEIRSIPPEALPSDVSLQRPLTVFRGKGCARCEDTGYKGRMAIIEIVEMTPRMREIVAADQMHNRHVVEEELRAQSMVQMRQDGIIKALRGVTTIEEVWAATKE